MAAYSPSVHQRQDRLVAVLQQEDQELRRLGKAGVAPHRVGVVRVLVEHLVGRQRDELGGVRRGIALLDKASYSIRMQAGMAATHFFAGRFDTALSWSKKTLGDLPDFLMAIAIVAANHALTGREDEALHAMEHLVRS